MKSLVVAVLAFDRISAFHLSVPCAVFGEAPREQGDLKLVVCSAESRTLKTTAGFDVTTQHGLSALKKANIIIVPSWRNIHERPPQAMLDALVAAYKQGAKIVGLCLGAFVLAEAGLLNGRQATTHWERAQEFAERFPEVQVNINVLYVEDHNIVTSAGTAAGIDCCLYLLRQRYGTEYTNQVARRMVVPPHRQGGQSQFIEQPIPIKNLDSMLSSLTDWVRANLNLPHSVDSLAAKALMSRRTFTRHFRQLTGTTVTQWLLNERLRLSQVFLETSDQSVEAIAMLAGFGSVVTLRHHFRLKFGVAPIAWRTAFQGKES